MLRTEMDELQAQTSRSLPLGLKTAIFKVIIKHGNGYSDVYIKY